MDMLLASLLSMLLVSFIYLIVIMIIFGVKEKVDTFDTRIYKKILITNFVSLVLEMSLYIIGLNTVGQEGILYYLFIFMTKIFTCCVCLWYYEMKNYTVAIYSKFANKERNVASIHNILFLIMCLIVMILPTYQYYGYTSGPSTKFAGLIMMIECVIMVYHLIKVRRFINNKEFVPIILSVLSLTITIVVQLLNPRLLLFNLIITLVTIIMYHTIENPDMKLVNQLNIAKDAADRANNAKTDFLSSMSHEIRTPLNAIVGFSNGLLEQELSDQTKEDVNNIITASNNLLELVNGILDISKIEAGKLEIIESNYSFDKMYNELIVLTRTRIGEKPIEFRYNKDASMPEYFYGDGNRLKQVVLNLLTNAAKYTNNGFIDFNVSYVKIGERARFIISVSDSGLGISKENLEKLFTKFERLNVEKNTTIEGTGLGLAITKNLIEMMGGKILVESEEGKGSKFTVIVEQGITSEEEVNNIKQKEATTQSITSNIEAKGKKVLIVDDNSLNLKVAERLLKKYEIDTETCLSGFECLDKISLGQKYDLIFMDDMMPKMNGQETFKKLKNDGNFNTPVIILTANAISGMKEQYLSLGFDDYLSKPIEKVELERVINKYLN